VIFCLVLTRRVYRDFLRAFCASSASGVRGILW
jgi:hypothetical protein